jgi:MFS family permease
MVGVRRRLARGALYAGAFLGPFGGGMTVAMLPELGATYGVPAATAAASVSAYLLPFGSVMLVSGTLGERWGLQRTVVVAFWAYGLSSIACVVAPSLPLFLAARAAQGTANAFTTPLLLAAVRATVPDERLGRANGWYSSLQAAGQTFAALLGGLAADIDWRLAFVGVAVVAAVLGVVGIPQVGRSSHRATLRSAWRPAVLRIGLVAGLGWACLVGLGFLIALRLEETFSLGAGSRGLVLTGLGVVGLLTGGLVGGRIDRIGPERGVLIGAWLGVLVVVGVGVAPTVWLVAAFWATGGVAGQLMNVGVNTLVDRYSHGNKAGALSVVQALRFGGGALGPVAIPPLFHAHPLAGFLVPAALLAIVVPIALPGRTNRVAPGVTDSPDNFTTDPPRPPGTPDVDDLVGNPVPTGEQRTEPDNEDVADDTASVEPPD